MDSSAAPKLGSPIFGLTHIWGCSDIPRLNFTLKISFVKYFSSSLNILHFISGSRILREGIAVACGHRHSHPDVVPGVNIVPCTIPHWGQALLWGLWGLQGLGPPGAPCCTPASWNDGLVWFGMGLKQHPVPLPGTGRDIFPQSRWLQALSSDTSRDRAAALG